MPRFPKRPLSLEFNKQNVVCIYLIPINVTRSESTYYVNIIEPKELGSRSYWVTLQTAAWFHFLKYELGGHNISQIREKANISENK
jgi:hypothetical protein